MDFWLSESWSAWRRKQEDGQLGIFLEDAERFGGFCLAFAFDPRGLGLGVGQGNRWPDGRRWP